MPNSWLKKWSIGKGWPEQQVKSAIEGHQNQIRKSADVYIKGSVQRMITDVAKEYGALKEVDPLILKECVKLVCGEPGQKGKFGMLGISEIREAYRQWASEEIVIKGGEMYGGVFNARQFGKVLSAYLENRNRIIAEYIKDRDEKERLEMERIAQAKKQAEYEQNFTRYLQECKADDWQGVPEHWYNTAMNRGMIKFEPGEAVLIFEEAKVLAHSEIITSLEECKSVFLKAGFEMQLQDGSIERRAKVIARKITVFRKLIEVKTNQNKH